MDAMQGAPRPPALNTQHATTTREQPGAVSNRRSPNSAMNSPLPSTPATPNPQTAELARRPSHPATSPIPPPASPNAAKSVRRASSAMSLNSRPTSSPGLKKKSSRSSLGGQPDDNERRPTPKRSISNLITGLREAHSKMEAIEEPIPLTAPQIAVEHFARELIAHSREDCASEVAVILHDACYGHRYSRLKTTKTTLSMIVERPERIHASILGASTAYVRLGGHHAAGRNAPHPDVVEAAPPPFKVRRTGRTMDITSPCVTNVHGTGWMTELKGMCGVAGERLAAGAKELERTATATTAEAEKRKLHEGDLYLSSESLNAFQGALGGVADAVDTVFASGSQTKRAFVAVRPPGHHCSADHPSGFCWLNNVHVGIEYAAQTYGLTHAAMLDFDLHHGDGSQAITWQRNSKNNEKRVNAKPNSKLKLSPDLGYYSLHDINSYPCEMGDDEKVQAASLCIDNAHGQSIWNVHLEEWKTVDEFWELYERKYSVLLQKARGFLRLHTSRLRREGKVTPNAAIFISAGFDASEWEGAGMQRHKVNVPTEFYARFTKDVVEMAQEEGLGCDGRVISVLEGGYSDRALCSGVLSHLSGLCAAPAVEVKDEPIQDLPLDQMMRGLGINGTSQLSSHLEYDTSWWSAENLTALELKVNPPPPALAKKMRMGQQPTYATPTESFAYKVVDTDKFARSISGTMRDVGRPARPPTPPAPEVDWVVATQELSKLLIPTDRQTRSCTPDELAGPKAHKPRVSAMPTVSLDEVAKPRQLRDRKAKGPAYAGTTHSDELESLRSVSRSSRRQTIADFAPNSDPVESSTAAGQRRASRRLSAGSTLSSIGGDLDPAPPPVPSVSTAAPGARRASGMMKPPPPPAAGMAVKKTRAPPAAAATATKTKKTAASAPVSPAQAKRSLPPTARGGAPPAFGQTQNAAAQPPAQAPNGAGPEVDALTSGMKRITLKVGTKEEHDRKQKEKLDADRRARALKGAETRRVNAAAKKAAAAAVKEGPANGGATAGGDESGSAPVSATQTISPASEATTIIPDTARVANVSPAQAANTNGSILATSAPAPAPAPVQQATDVHMDDTMPVPQGTSATLPQQTLSPDVEPSHVAAAEMLPPQPHVPVEHYTPPQPTSIASNVVVPDSAARQFIHENNVANGASPEPTFGYPAQAPPSLLPMNGGGQQLPVWSSTGKLPFAAAPVSYGQPAPDYPVSQASNGFPQSENEVPKTQAWSGLKKEDASVWDVPETPQR